MKIKELAYFTDSIMKINEIARKIGSAVHAKPRLERVAWRRPFHPLGTRLVPRSLRLRKCRNSSAQGAALRFDERSRERGREMVSSMHTEYRSAHAPRNLGRRAGLALMRQPACALDLGGVLTELATSGSTMREVHRTGRKTPWVAF